MENFPTLMREKLKQIKETQTAPNKKDPKKLTPRYIIIKMPNFKDKERILSSKGKTSSIVQGSSDKAISRFLNRNTTSHKGMARNIPSNEKQRTATKTTLPSRALT